MFDECEIINMLLINLILNVINKPDSTYFIPKYTHNIFDCQTK